MNEANRNVGAPLLEDVERLERFRALLAESQRFAPQPWSVNGAWELVDADNSPIASAWPNGFEGASLDLSVEDARFIAAAVEIAIEWATERTALLEQVRRRQWMPIETAPKDGTAVLVGYYDHTGQWQSVRAVWVEEGALECMDSGELSIAGWREEPRISDTLYLTDETPTHWMPMPEPPSGASSGEDVGG